MPQYSDSERTLWEKVKKRKWKIAIGSVSFFIILIWAIKSDNWANWTGFGKRETVENQEPGKTLWDWLDLLGVPITLAILGYILQQQQQKRSERLSNDQREIADNEAKEEVLQNYFDRLSSLLIDKNLLAIAAKANGENSGESINPEQKELLNAGVDVIRARTLSILRRLGNNPERKTSVIRFLIEAEVTNKTKLDLSDAALSGTDLSGTNLSGTNLSGVKLIRASLTQTSLINADLTQAKLLGANLINADLFNADLTQANLLEADLSSANLTKATLTQTNFCNADIKGAKLINVSLRNARYLTDEQLTQAKLCRTRLPEGSALGPNRDCEELGIDPVTGEQINP